MAAESSWNLCVCGSIEQIFAVFVKKNASVAELKVAIEVKSHIPVDEQSLYFQEQLMQDDRILSSIPELNDGGIVYLSRRPLTLNINSLLSSPPQELQIKLHHTIKNREVRCLKSILHDRVGVNNGTQSILMFGGEILNEGTILSQYPGVTDGAKLILQKQPAQLHLNDRGVYFTFHSPQGTNMSFLKQQLSYTTGVSHLQLKCGAYVLESERNVVFRQEKEQEQLQFKNGYMSRDEDESVQSTMQLIRRDGWILDVQRLNGTKVSVHVPERKNMPIVKLKECIEECTGVLTHQQRLTIGDTIVEDWDEEDKMMFIGDYPNIQHGSLLYLIQHDGGHRMKVQNFSSQLQLVKKGPVDYHYQTRYYYVNSIKSQDDLKNKILALKSKNRSSNIRIRIDQIRPTFGPDCIINTNSPYMCWTTPSAEGGVCYMYLCCLLHFGYIPQYYELTANL